MDPLVLARLAMTMANDSRRERRSTEHQAIVLRVDQSGTYWVRIPGGADETPIRTTTVEAHAGDVVAVTISNGSARMHGNVTSPTATTRTVSTVSGVANEALQEAVDASIAAESAIGSAKVAKEAADAAQASATEAAGSARDALSSATRANGYATDALVQLSVVESVVETLSWVSEHGTYTPTQDSRVDETKAYFVLVDGVYELVQNPVDDGLSTYYELSIDEAMSNYVATHLALTDEGLWVVPTVAYAYRITEDTELVDGKVYYTLVDGQYEPVASPQAADIASYYEYVQVNGYRLLVSNDSVTIVDPNGRNVSTFGESISFSSEREQRIGGTDAYVAWVDTDNDGVADSLRIVADDIEFSGGVGIMRNGDTAELQKQVDDAAAAIDAIGGYVRINTDAASLELGRRGAMAKAYLDNDSLDFLYGDSVAASVGVDDDGNGTLYIDRAKVRDGGYIQLGSWQWVPRANGNVALKWVGGDV